MTQRMTFSFRCPTDLKNAFSAKAKANGTTASALIKRFMEDYINGSTDSSIDKNTSDEDSSTDNKNGSYADSELAQLQSALTELQSQVNRLEKTQVSHSDIEGISCSLPSTDTEAKSTDNADDTITSTDTIINGTDNDSENQSYSENGSSLSKNQEPIQPELDSNLADREQVNQDSSELVTQQYLAQRMGVSAPTIAKYLKKGSIEEANQFCKRKDPDGQYWQWDKATGKFYSQLHPLQNG